MASIPQDIQETLSEEQRAQLLTIIQNAATNQLPPPAVNRQCQATSRSSFHSHWAS